MSLELNKSQLALYLGKRLARVVGGLIGTLFHHLLQICLVSHQLGKAGLNGCERIRARLADRQFEVTVALALELALDLVKFLARVARIDGNITICDQLQFS